MTALDLTAIREHHEDYTAAHRHIGAFDCCLAHASADDVPALVAEVERLRAGLSELVTDFGEIATTARAKGDESWRMAQTAVISCRALLKESLR